jgi:hypothetical protein
MAKPIDEEAHFRIDEIERKIASVPSTEHIAGIAGGAVSVMLSEIKRELAEIKTRQAEDIALDREVIQSNLDLRAAMKELCENLCKPTTREISAQLPSGRVTMTVNETRN